MIEKAETYNSDSLEKPFFRGGLVLLLITDAIEKCTGKSGLRDKTFSALASSIGDTGAICRGSITDYMKLRREFPASTVIDELRHDSQKYTDDKFRKRLGILQTELSQKLLRDATSESKHRTFEEKLIPHIKRIIDLIINDESLDNEKFYIFKDVNRFTTRSELSIEFDKENLNPIPYEVCFESFLLGVWIVGACRDNKEDPPREPNQNNSFTAIAKKENTWKYRGTLGDQLTRPIKLTFYDPDKPPEDASTDSVDDSSADINSKKNEPDPTPPVVSLSNFPPLVDALKEDNLSGRLSLQYEPNSSSARKNIVFLCGSNGNGKTYAVRTWINNKLSNSQESRYQQHIQYDYINWTVYEYTGESGGGISVRPDTLQVYTPTQIFNDFKSRPQNTRRALVIDSFFEVLSIDTWKLLFLELQRFNNEYTDVFVLTPCNPTWFYPDSRNFPYSIFVCGSLPFEAAVKEFTSAAGSINMSSEQTFKDCFVWFRKYHNSNIGILRDTGKLIRNELLSYSDFFDLVSFGAGFVDILLFAKRYAGESENSVLENIANKLLACHKKYSKALHAYKADHPKDTTYDVAVQILNCLWCFDSWLAVKFESKRPNAYNDSGLNLKLRYHCYPMNLQSSLDSEVRIGFEVEDLFSRVKKHFGSSLNEWNFKENFKKAISFLKAIGAIKSSKENDTEYLSIDDYLLASMDYYEYINNTGYLKGVESLFDISQF